MPRSMNAPCGERDLYRKLRPDARRERDGECSAMTIIFV